MQLWGHSPGHCQRRWCVRLHYIRQSGGEHWFQSGFWVTLFQLRVKNLIGADVNTLAELFRLPQYVMRSHPHLNTTDVAYIFLLGQYLTNWLHHQTAGGADVGQSAFSVTVSLIKPGCVTKQYLLLDEIVFRRNLCISRSTEMKKNVYTHAKTSKKIENA